VGKTLSLRGFDGATVVGVVDDVRYENIEEAPRPNVYISASQSARQEGFLLVRTMVDPASLVSAIRQTLREMDSNLPLFDVRMMRERVEAETWRTRFSTLMISLFASVTLLLSAVGIYGVLSYSVDRRSHDIGVSKALGATQTSVLKGVVGRALLTVIVGIALGIAAALAGARLLAALLYETSPYDPLTYGAVALVFITVALAAGYFPARRASSVNPVDALRAE
jgi:ABC-type antimicrobial peptide transport system permease subunit